MGELCQVQQTMWNSIKPNPHAFQSLPKLLHSWAASSNARGWRKPKNGFELMIILVLKQKSVGLSPATKPKHDYIYKGSPIFIYINSLSFWLYNFTLPFSLDQLFGPNLIKGNLKILLQFNFRPTLHPYTKFPLVPSSVYNGFINTKGTAITYREF